MDSTIPEHALFICAMNTQTPLVCRQVTKYLRSASDYYRKSLKLIEKIEDLEAVTSMLTRYLASIDLSNTKVTDLSLLSMCTGLTNVNLNRTNVIDLSALTNCTALTDINLQGTKVTDLKPLINWRPHPAHRGLLWVCSHAVTRTGRSKKMS